MYGYFYFSAGFWFESVGRNSLSLSPGDYEDGGSTGVRTQGLPVWAPNLFFVLGVRAYRRAPGFPNLAHAESRLTRRAHMLPGGRAAKRASGTDLWNTRGCCAQAGYDGPLGRAADGHKKGGTR